jgi:hypothetical protein
MAITSNKVIMTALALLAEVVASIVLRSPTECPHFIMDAHLLPGAENGHFRPVKCYASNQP